MFLLVRVRIKFQVALVEQKDVWAGSLYSAAYSDLSIKKNSDLADIGVYFLIIFIILLNGGEKITFAYVAANFEFSTKIHWSIMNKAAISKERKVRCQTMKILLEKLRGN